MEPKSHEYKENVTDIVFLIVREILFFSFYQSVRLISEYMYFFIFVWKVNEKTYPGYFLTMLFKECNQKRWLRSGQIIMFIR